MGLGNIGALRDSRLLFLLSIISESVYFASSLTNVSALLRTIVAFPSCFILPGLIFVLVLRADMNIVKLVVVGFFVSTIFSVILMAFTFMLDLHLVPLTYSLVMFALVLFLTILASFRSLEFKSSKQDIMIITFVFSVYAVLVLYFGGIQRHFSFDETAYLFSARMGIIEGIVPPFGGTLNAAELSAFVQGRYFWTYLLSSFISSTGLTAYEAGLIGVGFLVMTALASSLLVKNKWLSTAVFIIVAANPALFSFSGLALNDIAIAFYIVFAIVFFVQSFSKVSGNVSIDIRNLFISFLGLVPLTLIKMNLLIVFPAWLILLYILFRYKLYKINRKYEFLLLFTSLPVLAYEIFLDIPFVISVWILRSTDLANLFRKFLFISPVESFIELFFTPPWNPNAPTLFTRRFIDYFQYFYSLMGPDSLSLLISAVILSLPILILSRNLLREFNKRVLAILIILSIGLQYYESIALNISFIDVGRYALWMIPLWIPLALVTLNEIKSSLPLSFSKIKPVFPIAIAAIILVWINISLIREVGSVIVGFGYLTWLSADAIINQLFLSIPLLIFLMLLVKVRIRHHAVKIADLAFCLAIVLILLNAAYFGSQSIGKNWLYENHSFTTIGNDLNAYAHDGSLVFANNYIFMRDYVNDTLLKNSLILPPPPTREEFLRLLEIVPNNTLFLISDDSAATYYEDANSYIKDYISSEVINPETQNTANHALRIDYSTTASGSVSLFRVNRGNTQALNEISVYDFGISINNNSTVTFKIKVDTLGPGRVNVLVSTDHATDIFSSSLVAGRNDLEYLYYQTGAWVIVMTENGDIIYKNYVAYPSSTVINDLLIVSLVTTVSLFAALSWKKKTCDTT